MVNGRLNCFVFHAHINNEEQMTLLEYDECGLDVVLCNRL